MVKVVGTIGVILILILSIIYIRYVFNADPIFMGETHKVTGYVLTNNIVPSGKGAAHNITYEYTIKEAHFTDHYMSNKAISRLNIGDSLKLEVSISTPSKNKVIGYFRTKK